MRIKIDNTICMSCGWCEYVCPAVFKMIDDFQVAILCDVIPQQYEILVEYAIEDCPASAISIVKT